jgi:uncharacterized protein with GYD domain
MSHYLVRWQFTLASARALVGHPHDRAGAAKVLVEGFGGKLHSYFFTFGEFDGLGICEFADPISAAAFAMSAVSTGGFARWETTALLTTKEAEAAMQLAHDTKTAYRPPNA